MTTTVTSFPLSKHTGGGDTTPTFSGQHVYLQFTWEVGLPSSPVQFSSHHHFYKLSRSWLLGGCRHSCLLRQFVYLHFCEGLPLPPLWNSGHPALFAACLFCCCCLLFSFFSFFPVLGSVCPGGYAGLAQGCLWEYHVPLSSPCGLHLPKWSGSWHLVVQELSWFLHLTMEWECYVQAGGVEESKFCLFLVVFPLRCISSISPRFYFWKHTFCFLPLVAILESVLK
jgi:hypothetical protein